MWTWYERTPPKHHTACSFHYRTLSRIHTLSTRTSYFYWRGHYILTYGPPNSVNYYQPLAQTVTFHAALWGMYRYTEARLFQHLLPSGVFGRWLLHKQRLHFFFPHCLLVTLKISFFHSISHLRLSLKWSQVSSWRGPLELLFHGEQHYTI